MHPSDGARFLLVWDSSAPEGDIAHYQGSIYTPGERFDYEIILGMDGKSKLSPNTKTAEPHLERKLATIARVIARNAAQKRSQGLAAWPPRILRWRPV